MNFEEMIASHQQSGADVTIAGLPVSDADASSMGIMRVDATDRVVGFLEKPQTAEELELVRLNPQWFADHDIPALQLGFLDDRLPRALAGSNRLLSTQTAIPVKSCVPVKRIPPNKPNRKHFLE